MRHANDLGSIADEIALVFECTFTQKRRQLLGKRLGGLIALHNPNEAGVEFRLLNIA